MRTYCLLNGAVLDLRSLAPREQKFLSDLRKMAPAGADYWAVYRAAVGPGSIALRGRNGPDKHIMATPLYLAALDITKRVGIEQGLLAPRVPTHKDGISPGLLATIAVLCFVIAGCLLGWMIYDMLQTPMVPFETGPGVYRLDPDGHYR